jgi:glycosyltransferase involved in cell wall biosynthesis
MKTLSRTRFALYSSEWASKSARLHYGVSIEKIYQIPFGPNITDDLINRYYSPKSVASTPEIVFIFVSVDWGRKNGNKAIDVCRLLVESGIRVRLILVGHVPESARRINFVDYRGFLRKSDPEQLLELCRVYRESHFLLLPTTAEAFGIVFSEAQAFGIPPVTHDVGGVGSAVTDGKTGLLLPLGAPPAEFAKAIMRYISEPERYRDLSLHCRDHYLQRANWGSWSTLIFQLSHQGPDSPRVLETSLASRASADIA